MSRSRNALLGLVLTALLVPGLARGQERTVVSKEVAVGRSEASLRLEFSDGAPLEIALRDGSVVIDGSEAGSYAAGDPLEAAWRSLLGSAVALDDGPLSRALLAWSPPADLQGTDLALAERIDAALEDALSARAAPEAPAAPSVSLSLDEGDGTLVRALIGQLGRLSTLEEALKGVDSKIQLHVEEDVTVGAGETLEGNLVVVQGDVVVKGTVTGDVVVVDGSLELAEGGRILGDVRLADAQLDRQGGVIEGDLVNVVEQERDVEADLRDRLRSELRDEIRNEIRSNVRGDRGGWSLFSPFRSVFRGVGGLLENVIVIVILGLVGMGVVAFAPENLEAVAETARRTPGRAAMVGLAGSFLLVPVWIIGAVALAVSIVGIPVMIAWLPLFPLAALAAALLGYLSVAKNTGEWLADSGYRYTDWIRKSNPVYTVVGGLVGLMAAFMVGNLLSIVPFFGFFRGLLTFVGVMLTVVAVQIGFGAVLLTRAGRKPEYYGNRDFDEDWARAVDVDVEVDADPAGTKSDGGNDA
ncbi:MAG TPA: hypothetical protein VJ997_03155 [Longimicrobiales bacterium]|nr:hypothetical protein [Longimicrobiales bacterium]